jgi:peptidoglycan L-alanyl-D-glutamate endopeptidase CwlK
MPKFSLRSEKALNTAHPELQRLFREVIKHFDCVVLEGHRDKVAQDAAVAAGKSKTPWPTSKHNKTPAQAVDVVPYPIDWGNRNRFFYFAGFVKATAAQLGITVRWGGDWDSDDDFGDQTFEDLPHWEIRL